MDVSNIRFSNSQSVYQKRQHGSPSPSEAKDSAPAQQSQPAETKNTLNSDTRNPEKLSNEEKQFFEQLFPSAAGEIRSYQSYDKDGMKMAARLGAFVDKKG